MHARPPLRSASGGCGDGSRFRRVVTKASTDDDSVPGPRSEGGRSRKESEGDSKISGVRRDDEKILQSGAPC